MMLCGAGYHEAVADDCLASEAAESLWLDRIDPGDSVEGIAFRSLSRERNTEEDRRSTVNAKSAHWPASQWGRFYLGSWRLSRKLASGSRQNVADRDIYKAST
ncbi:MAG: hypothetical protein AB7G28_24825 [Pirellulales bacterium]